MKGGDKRRLKAHKRRQPIDYPDHDWDTLPKSSRRRWRLFRRLARDNKGRVMCYVCHEDVEWLDSSIEHICPRSKGGSDHISNLTISHEKCNALRGNGDNYTRLINLTVRTANKKGGEANV
jgi:5-methylcytosine-specific restriction endonuclease McrA